MEGLRGLPGFGVDVAHLQRPGGRCAGIVSPGDGDSDEQRVDLAEAALSHSVGRVEGAYFRSDLFERRHRLMDTWAAYVGRTDNKVVALHG